MKRYRLSLKSIMGKQSRRDELLRDVLEYFTTRGFDCLNTPKENSLIERLKKEFPEHESHEKA